MTRKISWAVAVAQFGEDWAEEQAAAGKVEENPDAKKYGDHFPFVKKMRKIAAGVDEEMNAAGLPGSFRVQLVDTIADEG